MRNKIVLLAALVVTAPVLGNRSVGKTYLTNFRDPFQATSPERVTLDRDDRMHRKDDGYGGDLSATGMYIQSLDSQAIRDYFLPVAGQKSIIAGELYSAANQTNPTTINVISNYFNVFTANVAAPGDLVNLTSESVLTFNPKQKMAGVAFQWQQSFKEKYFFKVTAPVMHVSNDLGMVEAVTNAGGGAVPTGAVANMTEAFRQTALKYGKIDGKQEKWGVADMELIIGRDWIDDETAQMSFYVGAVCPTGNRPKGEYLWEAIIGNNHHWGAFFGSSSRYIWREGDNYVIAAYCDTDARYLFENTQTRMIDLQGRPWSRYLYLANTDTTGTAFVGTSSLFDQPTVANSLEFGVNYLTQQVRVAPHGSFSINSALNYRRDNGLEAELGLNFYARQDEHVKLKNAFANPNNYGIPALAADLGTPGWGNTVSFATINNAQAEQSDGDVDYQGNAITVVIRESDLDLNSAATPAVLESTVYGSLGKSWNDCRFPCFAGVGGSYTYNNDNSSVRRFTVWGKAGLSF